VTQSLDRLQQNEVFSRLWSRSRRTICRAPSRAPASQPMSAGRNSRLSLRRSRSWTHLYTPDYPDVVAISRKIADLQAEIAHAPAEPAPVPAAPDPNHPDPPHLMQLKFQLRACSSP
jgi:hypothetical protein